MGGNLGFQPIPKTLQLTDEGCLILTNAVDGHEREIHRHNAYPSVFRTGGYTYLARGQALLTLFCYTL